MLVHRGVAGCFALAIATTAFSPAHAALQQLVVKMDQYAAAVDVTPNQVQATLTVKDLASGGVSFDVALNNATYFASTGGPHITFAFNLNSGVTTAFSNFTFSPTTDKSLFNFVTNKNAGNTFGAFSYGIDGTWNGTNNNYSGPIDFTVSNLSVSNFASNSNGYWAVADVLGSAGTGEVGGKTGAIGPAIPEPSTWAMMGLGFAGLGFAGFRKAKGQRAIAA